MKQEARRRIHNEDGMIWPIAILLTAVIAAAILFIVIPGYREHLRNARIEMDSTSVATATDIAKVTYLQNGEQGLVTYYYDERSHKCLLLDEIDTIEPYGRSSEEDNRNQITGAKGIPNLGKDNGGAQFLAITIENDQVINIRWTGKKCTVQDYELMTIAERNALTTAQLDQIEQNRQELEEDANTAETGR